MYLGPSAVIAANSLNTQWKRSIAEVQRIGKNAFITLDAWRNEEEKQRMQKSTLINWVTGLI